MMLGAGGGGDDDSNGEGLPNFDRAVIPDEKLLYTIRDPGKGRTMAALGFTEENHILLEEQVRLTVPNTPAEKGNEDQYGTRYSVVAAITGPQRQ